MAGPSLIVLTGEIQTGKTSLLMQWTKSRNEVAGILSPVIEGKRFFHLLPSGESLKMEADEEDDVRLNVGRFAFSDESFKKVSNYLRKLGREEKWKFIIIDELGPLELIDQQGLWDAFHYVSQIPDKIIIIIVRTKLLDQLQDRLTHNFSDIQITTISEFEDLSILK